MWYFVESVFLLNLIILLNPLIHNKTKKFWSLVSYTVLTGYLLFFLFCGSGFAEILNLNNFFFSTDQFFIHFGFPIIFVSNNITCIFCFLTVFLAVICQLIVWQTPNYQTNQFLIILWLFEFSLSHTFSSINLLSFYISLEISLIPMALLILIWGSRQRKIHATYVFFSHTVFGSVSLLMGLLYLYLNTHTLLIQNLSYLKLPLNSQFILWIFFFLGFGIKVPVVPVHTWLPEAHVEAPTIGSVLLAGLLLKVGTFGILIFMFPILNEASHIFQPFVYLISLTSIYHASLLALRQFDLKKAIAYSSIAHMGFVILGLFSFNSYGISGALFIMFSHGLVASALSFLTGVIYDRYKTRNLLEYGGLATTMPIFSVFFFLMVLANLSFPGTSNFIGESVTLIGLTENNYLVSLFVTPSIIITSCYSIWIFNRMIFGSLSVRLVGFSDLDKFEFTIISLLSILVLFLGFKPDLLLSGLDKFALVILMS